MGKTFVTKHFEKRRKFWLKEFSPFSTIFIRCGLVQARPDIVKQNNKGYGTVLHSLDAIVSCIDGMEQCIDAMVQDIDAVAQCIVAMVQCIDFIVQFIDAMIQRIDATAE